MSIYSLFYEYIEQYSRVKDCFLMVREKNVIVVEVFTLQVKSNLCKNIPKICKKSILLQ